MYGRKIGIITLLGAAFMTSACAGGKPAGEAGRHGFSEAGLAELRGHFERAIAQGEIAGMVGLIVRDDKIVFSEALGMRDREGGDPMRPDNIFFIASLTKIVTSAAAMILVDEGKLKLDDPVANYLPNLANLKVLEKDGDGWKEVAPRRPMTVRHLLTHTAGLTYGWYTNDRVDQLLNEKGITKDNKTVADLVAKLSSVPLKHHPGEVWEYSLATDVLGRVVEVISGQTLDEFMRARIFKPLDMKDTGFGIPDDKLGRLAADYKLEDGKAVRNEKHFRPFKTTYFGGGGSMASTARDYCVFMQMLLGGGEYNGVRILKKESVKAMTTNQIEGVRISENTPWVGNGFGLGLSIQEAPGKKGVCYSWSGATGTLAWFSVDKKIVGVFMVHISDERFREKFYELAYQALIE